MNANLNSLESGTPDSSLADCREQLSLSDCLEPLSDCREQISLIDRQIALLLEKRLELAREIGRIKESVGIPIRDENRESEVIEIVAESLSQPELRAPVARIYRRIMRECRLLQSPEPDKAGPTAQTTYKVLK